MNGTTKTVKHGRGQKFRWGDGKNHDGGLQVSMGGLIGVPPQSTVDWWRDAMVEERGYNTFNTVKGSPIYYVIHVGGLQKPHPIVINNYIFAFPPPLLIPPHRHI